MKRFHDEVRYRLWNCTAYPFNGPVRLRSDYPLGHRIYWPLLALIERITDRPYHFPRGSGGPR